MWISSINCVIMTIFFVNNCPNCYAPVDEYGKAMCIAEIKLVFAVKKENLSGRSFAEYAFKYLRNDDWDVFKNKSYAYIYYRTIRKNNYIYPATNMLLPNQYCNTNPAVNFKAYVEERIGKHIIDPIEACKTQMYLNGIPNTDNHQEILNFIYDHKVLPKLNNCQNQYVAHYISTLNKQFHASGTMEMEDFCRMFNTTEGQLPDLRMGTLN